MPSLKGTPATELQLPVPRQEYGLSDAREPLLIFSRKVGNLDFFIRHF